MSTSLYTVEEADHLTWTRLIELGYEFTWDRNNPNTETCVFLLISEDQRTPLKENKHHFLLKDRIVLRSHMHSRMSRLKRSCPRAWNWAKFTPQVIKELLGEEKHGWMNQHSHLTSCSRICMNNATALHLLHQVREGECSCSNCFSCERMIYKRKHFIFMAILRKETHNSVKEACLWMDTHTYTRISWQQTNAFSCHSVHSHYS